MEQIENLQEAVRVVLEEGRELLCIDESTFSTKMPKRAHWAPATKAL